MSNQVSGTDASSDSASRQKLLTWYGPMLLLVALVVMLVAFAFVPSGDTQPDTMGADDAGVAHPQPLGIDDDVSR